MKAHVQVDRERIGEFCHRWKVVELALFGSVLRDDFRPDSDVDVLVTFAEDAHWGLFDSGQMESQLQAIFGRKVDLITRHSLTESPNYIRRNHILQHMEVVHVAG